MPHDDEREQSPEEARLAQLAARRTALTESEVALLRKVFHGIYLAHHARVWDKLAGRGLDREKVEDLVQDTFRILFQEIKAEGFPDSIPGKLRTIAEHLLLNELRDRRRSPLSLGLPSSGSEPPQSPPRLEGILDRAELARQVRAELSEQQRIEVNLVVVGRLTYAEAAAELDIPVTTLKARIVAAKKVILKVAKRLLPPSQR